MSTKALVPVEEYLRMSFEGSGPEYVKHVWLVAPASESFSVYDDAGLREVPTLELPEFKLTIQKSDVFE